MVKLLVQINEDKQLEPYLLNYADEVVLALSSISSDFFYRLEQNKPITNQEILSSLGRKNKSFETSIFSNDSAGQIVNQKSDITLCLPITILEDDYQFGLLLDKSKSSFLSQIYFEISENILTENNLAFPQNTRIIARLSQLASSMPCSLIISPSFNAFFLAQLDSFKSNVFDWLNSALSCGINKVLLSCFELTKDNRLDVINAICYFLKTAKEIGVENGILGNLQVPDISRLLPFKPDYIGFIYSPVKAALTNNNKLKNNKIAGKSSDIILNDGAIHDYAELSKLYHFLSKSNQMTHNTKITSQEQNTDKILVKDFVLPVHIGVYNHERNQPQSVCFNIGVEISRTIGDMHNMDNVFSYDIIIDAITSLSKQNHIDYVETLAEQIAKILLGFSRVQKVTVRVEKLDLAPRAVGIEIVRTRQIT